MTRIALTHAAPAHDQMVERGSPIFLFQCQAHQINCIRDTDGNVVDGRDDEIRSCFYAFALQRKFDEDAGELKWEVVEFSMLGSVQTL